MPAAARPGACPRSGGRRDPRRGPVPGPGPGPAAGHLRGDRWRVRRKWASTARATPPGGSLEAGSLDDAVPVTGVVRADCNLPFWQVRSVWMTTASIVRDGRAKRRNLSIRTARLKSPATFVQVVPSEDGAELTRLFQEVGAMLENPPFVFVTLTSAGRVRDYAIALAID